MNFVRSEIWSLPNYFPIVNEIIFGKEKRTLKNTHSSLVFKCELLKVLKVRHVPSFFAAGDKRSRAPSDPRKNFSPSLQPSSTLNLRPQDTRLPTLPSLIFPILSEHSASALAPFSRIVVPPSGVVISSQDVEDLVDGKATRLPIA
jgi:hypothetical protein